MTIVVYMLFNRAFFQHVISKDHGFPLNVEFLAKPQNLPVSAEFLRFHRIQYSLVVRGQIQHIFVGLRRP